ncbi:MAG TPA: hypothetical protein DCL77_20555 [Prolixibacteraceae bacterium]|nr:hypothetical protein [Prolixibacteraceae bacterium]
MSVLNITLNHHYITFNYLYITFRLQSKALIFNPANYFQSIFPYSEKFFLIKNLQKYRIPLKFYTFSFEAELVSPAT